MESAAPTRRTAADRLSAPAAGLDPPLNMAHDALNAAIPWLWWPLSVPPADRRLGAHEHALYAVHAGVGLAIGSALLPSRRRRLAVTAGALLAVASWAAFSGAWDRRADQAESWDRRAT